MALLSTATDCDIVVDLRYGVQPEKHVVSGPPPCIHHLSCPSEQQMPASQPTAMRRLACQRKRYIAANGERSEEAAGDGGDTVNLGGFRST
jgi:hypothetical protein